MTDRLADDLRLAAAGIDEGLAGSDWVALAYRIEEFADSFDQPGPLGFDESTGRMVRMQNASHNCQHWRHRQLWEFPEAPDD